MTAIQRFGPLVGRCLIALLFIPSGVGKLTGFAGTVGALAAKGVPLPSAIAAATVFVEIVVALALLVGFKARWAALLLALFTLAAAVLFHNFWAADAAQQMPQMINFFKNLAITGGLLFVAAFGPGPLAIDKT